jgi:NADH-quinone oxidoreductase subunit K
VILLTDYMILAVILFSIGVVGILSRKNIIVLYMSIELMLNAINIIFVALSRQYGNLDTQITALMVIAIAAAEAAIFLAVIVLLFRHKQSLDADLFNLLKQESRQ